MFFAMPFVLIVLFFGDRFLAGLAEVLVAATVAGVAWFLLSSLPVSAYDPVGASGFCAFSFHA